jgi:N-acylneuraminate cytidylyltransferase
MKKSLAIITARGGSKRIPRKNIRPFLGKPIIQYSIEAAREAGVFDEVMVSTDDEEIAAIARGLGAQVPFMRSAGTSNDYATTADVIAEVIDSYHALGMTFETCCCIYPTAPFVNAEKLRTAFDLLMKDPKAKSVVPVVRFGFPIQRSFKIEDGLAKMNWPEHMMTRSQDLTPAYHDCGQFYFLRTATFMEEKKLYTDHTIPLEMRESEVQDIDNEEDWRVAEIKYRFLQEKQGN